MTGSDDVEGILGAWYAGGEAEDPDVVVGRHPQQARALRAAFAARALLRGAAEPAWSLPRTIGDFRLLRELGRGGMGVVYEAEQLSLGRRVAVKVLLPGASPDGPALERFRREAKAVARLQHPHIVPVYAFGEAEGVWYFAMEWVRGRSLAEVIEARRTGAGEAPDATRDDLATAPAGPDHFRRTALAFADVAEALASAHAQGVIHRDVKPANLVLDEGGALKLLDFGVARVGDARTTTRAGELLGTLAYMSPEHVRGGGEHVDGRTDVYLLGATLYEFVTLRPPFAPADLDRLLAQILRKDPVPPRRLEPALPRDLEAIVGRALEKSPDARYPDAAAMAADLRAFAAGHRVAARRRGTSASLGGAVARCWPWGLVAACAVAATWVVVRERGEAPTAGPDRLGRSSGATAVAAIGAGPWQPRASLSVASSGLRAVFTDGVLYAISGYFTPRVAAYDPRTDQWRDVAPLPEALQYFGVAVHDRRIWVVGGDRGGAGPSDALRSYDPILDRWRVETPMPAGARSEVGAGAVDGRLYVVGGMDPVSNEPLDRVERYDVGRGAWTPCAPMPTARAPAGGVAVLDGKLFVAGGSDGSLRLRTLEVYDPEHDVWVRRAPLPVPMAGQAAVAEGRLVVVGGNDGDERRGFVYEPAADRWSELPPLSHARRGHGVAYDPVGRRLYVVGGYADGWRASLECCQLGAP